MEDVADVYADLVAIQGTLAYIKASLNSGSHAATVKDLENLEAELLGRIKAALEALPAKDREDVLHDLDQAYATDASSELRALIGRGWESAR